MHKDFIDYGFEYLINHIGWFGVLLIFAGFITICIKIANKER